MFDHDIDQFGRLEEPVVSLSERFDSLLLEVGDGLPIRPTVRYFRDVVDGLGSEPMKFRPPSSTAGNL
ncbi:hypothetical protein ACFY4I_25805 [Streptomyces scabiei]|uniref:hypothetical protein n=1 Tax=Streptomyces scabiei TaxID=1930 RepID=UPI0036C2CAC4